MDPIHHNPAQSSDAYSSQPSSSRRLSPIAMLHKSTSAHRPRVFNPNFYPRHQSIKQYVTLPIEIACDDLINDCKRHNSKLIRADKAIQKLSMIPSSCGAPPSLIKQKSELKKYASGLGVEIHLPINDEQCCIIENVLRRFESKGLSNDLRGIIIKSGFWRNLCLIGHTGRYLLETNTILIKSKKRESRRNRKGSNNEENRRLKWDEYWLAHEIIHAIHYTKNPNNAHLLNHSKFKPKAKETAMIVSRYASYNPIEFVAEVGAGLIMGKKYHSKIMNMYNEFGGPHIPTEDSFA